VIGFERSLVPVLKEHHHHALVLGTGGAAKAVAFVLNKLNINLLFVSRQTTNAATIHYHDLDEKILEKYSLIINATPIGMYPNEAKSPEIPFELLNEKHLLFDLIYKPEETLFLKSGKQQGCQTKNGYEMLILQAEASWEIWNEK
jgi:shikimate dehydrogenase